MEDNKMIKQAPPLQSRIVNALDNPSASAAELSELIGETELAIVTAEQTIASERAAATDLTSTPSAEAAEQAISRAEAAKINHVRLSGVLPKLRDRYTEALAIEHRDRWQATCNKVKAEQEALLQEYKGVDQAYRSAKAERDKLIGRMEDCDLDAQRVNDAASDLGIWDRRLEPLLDPPTPERRWGPPRIANGGLAVACAQSMVPPTYNPADWSKPEVRAQQRAEAEKRQREIGEHYQEQTAAQEERQNEEEAQRFTQAHKRG